LNRLLLLLLPLTTVRTEQVAQLWQRDHASSAILRGPEGG